MINNIIMINDSFVYIWTDAATHKSYIGVHKGTPDDGYICSSKPMLKAYQERPTDFNRQIVAYGPFNEMISLETQMLTEVNAAANSSYYNAHNGDGKFFITEMSDERRAKIGAKLKGNKNCVGRRMSEETKQKIRRAKLGTQMSVEARMNMSKAKKGVPQTPEAIENRRAKQIGRKHSSETRKKLSEKAKQRKMTPERLAILRANAQKMKERGHTEETKQRISEAHKGKLKSDEHKRKIGENTKKQTFFSDPEYKEKMSKALKGRIVSEETKEKMRIAALNRGKKS